MLLGRSSHNSLISLNIVGIFILVLRKLESKHLTIVMVGECAGKLVLSIRLNVVFGCLRLLLRGTALVDFGRAGVGTAAHCLLSFLLLNTRLGRDLGRCDSGAFTILVGEILLLDLAEADLGSGAITISTTSGNGVPVYLKVV